MTYSDATVVTETTPRSYEVESANGAYRCNHWHLIVLPCITPTSDESSSESELMQRVAETSNVCTSNNDHPTLY